MKKGLFRLQYELPGVATYTESGTREGARLDLATVADDEVRAALSSTQSLDVRGLVRWAEEHGNEGGGVLAVPLTTHTPEALAYRMEGGGRKLLYVMRPLHTIEDLDGFLYTANLGLAEGGYISCHTMTAVLRRKLIEQSYPKPVAWLVVAGAYLWHRVFPKLRLTRWLYFSLTKGNDRAYNRVEVLGRICRAGFEVVHEEFREGQFFVVAHKTGAPVDDAAPTGSLLVHLRRVGLNGKEIVVHKFRTMYTYSEYIQDYVYHYQSLERGGKFRNDYRVNFWGRLLRRTWLDELPMVWNLLRGDIKLVGVRPLSKQYFGLYSEEMQALRTRTKPGLLPPFYYDKSTPETIEEVQASERRYIEAYLEHPWATDWRYFWGIVGNIVFGKKRSK